MTPRKSAIKTDLFAADFHQQKLDQLGDPLLRIASCIDFPALAVEVDRVAPRPVSPQGGRPPYSTETMVRILVLKRLYHLSGEQIASCSRQHRAPTRALAPCSGIIVLIRKEIDSNCSERYKQTAYKLSHKFFKTIKYHYQHNR